MEEDEEAGVDKDSYVPPSNLRKSFEDVSSVLDELILLSKERAIETSGKVFSVKASELLSSVLSKQVESSDKLPKKAGTKFIDITTVIQIVIISIIGE